MRSLLIKHVILFTDLLPQEAASPLSWRFLSEVGGSLTSTVPQVPQDQRKTSLGHFMSCPLFLKLHNFLIIIHKGNFWQTTYAQVLTNICSRKWGERTANLKDILTMISFQGQLVLHSFKDNHRLKYSSGKKISPFLSFSPLLSVHAGPSKFSVNSTTNWYVGINDYSVDQLYVCVDWKGLSCLSYPK